MALPALERRPLVTVLGASGFVGSAVVAALASRDVRVRAVSRSRPCTPSAAAVASFEAYEADLTEPGNLADAVAGSDAVLYLIGHPAGWRGASLDSESERLGVGLVSDLVGVLRPKQDHPAPIVVFAGSTSQAGPCPYLPINGSEPDRPETIYDQQKHRAETILKEASAKGAVRGISVRLPTVYGNSPSPDTAGRGVLATMARKAIAGQALTMWHDGSVQRDLLHVRDAATAFLAAIDNADALAARHWVLGTGRGEPLGGVFRAIARIVSSATGEPPAPVVSVPPPPHAVVTDYSSVVVDSTAFRSATDWSPTIALSEGLRQMVAALLARPVLQVANLLPSLLAATRTGRGSAGTTTLCQITIYISTSTAGRTRGK